MSLLLRCQMPLLLTFISLGVVSCRLLTLIHVQELETIQFALDWHGHLLLGLLKLDRVRFLFVVGRFSLLLFDVVADLQLVLDKVFGLSERADELLSLFSSELAYLGLVHH